MPAAKPPEFRRRAVDLARSGQQPVVKIASDLGISESCSRRWMAESSHSQLDDWFYRGRLVALTVERQALVMLSFAVTHNAVADRHHRQRQRTPALAPAA